MSEQISGGLFFVQKPGGGYSLDQGRSRDKRITCDKPAASASYRRRELTKGRHGVCGEVHALPDMPYREAIGCPERDDGESGYDHNVARDLPG